MSIESPWLTGAILVFVTLQRVVELLYSSRNTDRLLRRGAYEAASGHYKLIVATHALWLGCLWVFAWGRPVILPFLVVFVALQAMRAWVLIALGRRWTTRIIVLPDEPLIEHGPYRYFHHPNYLVVGAEIACVPLIFGLVWLAVIFSIVNGLVLWLRVHCEAAALAGLAPPDRGVLR